MPIVITKTIAATVTKAVAPYRGQRSGQNKQKRPAWFIASQIGTVGCPVAVNIAERTHLDDVAEEFQVCRIPTPTRSQD